ncbi:hypothetical protein G3I32_21570, partial [Streptomyces coelicoflavus]|nr:hypothetical protein [Streptomyces coelicoflavus]
AAMAMARLGDRRLAADGARCLGAADALLPPGHVSTGMERDAREHAVERVREALGPEACDAAYAEGGRLSAQEAAALV